MLLLLNKPWFGFLVYTELLHFFINLVSLYARKGLLYRRLVVVLLVEGVVAVRWCGKSGGLERGGEMDVVEGL